MCRFNNYLVGEGDNIEREAGVSLELYVGGRVEISRD
jgi:hypothetical protein